MISNIIPAKWFYNNPKKALCSIGVGLAMFGKETLILIGNEPIFFIGLSVKKYKIRLE